MRERFNKYYPILILLGLLFITPLAKLRHNRISSRADAFDGSGVVASVPLADGGEIQLTAVKFVPPASSNFKRVGPGARGRQFGGTRRFFVIQTPFFLIRVPTPPWSHP